MTKDQLKAIIDFYLDVYQYESGEHISPEKNLHVEVIEINNYFKVEFEWLSSIKITGDEPFINSSEHMTNYYFKYLKSESYLKLHEYLVDAIKEINNQQINIDNGY